MQDYFIKELLGFKDAIIKKLLNNEDSIEIHIELPRKNHSCPNCNTRTSKVHDYRVQQIRDLSLLNKNTLLYYRKRRYYCPCCNKRFYERNDFVGRYKRFTLRVIPQILQALKCNYSLKSIAEGFNISINTIIRILDSLSYELDALPNVLSIDEFKGNTEKGKYQCILVNPKTRTVLDIISDRKYETLHEYFKKFKDRDKVKYFVIDMWKPYRRLAKELFKKAAIIIDRFHYVRNCIWALDKVRKNVQKKVSYGEYKFFKRSRKLLLAKPHKLSDNAKVRLAEVLRRNETIRKAYRLKELFMDFTHSGSKEKAIALLSEWFNLVDTYNLPEFNYLANTIRNWKHEILNSFDAPYTNGCTEGYNNKIKVIKRNAFGVRNFDRFRNRILHTCN